MGEPVTKDDLQEVKQEVSRRFEGVDATLKELIRTMQELVRIDGDMKRLGDALSRIGRQVDDHEVRIRNTETTASINTRSIGFIERHGAKALWIIVGGLLTFVLEKGVGG